jgi:hypothetical protein
MKESALGYQSITNFLIVEMFDNKSFNLYFLSSKMSPLAWSLLFCLFLVGSCSFSEENHQFNATYTHFRVLLRFAIESETLYIKVQNTKTMERYNQIIDQEYVNLREYLDGFTDPIELY